MSDEVQNKREFLPSRWQTISLVVAFIAGSVLYRYLMNEHYGYSAAMFIGIPAILAIALALTPKAKSATGGILKGITLGLLVIAPLLGEGYLCILMAAPIFYAIGLVVGVPMDLARKKERDKQTLSCIVLLLLPMSLEGVIPQLTFNRTQSVEATRIISASRLDVENALAQSPRIGERLPGFLKIGFPQPLEAHGNGLNLGAERTILFSGAEGDPPGYLVMNIAERRPGYVRFETVSDGSKLTQWIRWDSSEVLWTPIDSKHTRVTWRVRFERGLDPAWYFTPWERLAVRKAAEYLIDANATPSGAR
jgi:hypothetical protein